MGDYLQRFLDGECETAWQELVDLGEKALRPPVLEEATAVTEEVVRRMIHNVNIIGNYLANAGYEFETPGPFVVPADNKTAEGVRRIEQEYGELPLIMKVWWKRIDHLNLLQSDSQYASGVGCHTEGISPSSSLMIDSPAVCLQNSIRRAGDIRSNNQGRLASGESPEVLPDPELPFLVLGPCASNNDDVGFHMPVEAVDAHCDNEGANMTFVDLLRNSLLRNGGLRWMYFGCVQLPNGESEYRTLIREREEIESIASTLNLAPF